MRLGFTNDIEFLKSEIAREFPSQRDAFERMLGQLADYDDLNQETLPARSRVFKFDLYRTAADRDAALSADWYGNAREDDMDYGQFCIMFRSIFLEGLPDPSKVFDYFYEPSCVDSAPWAAN